MRNLEVKPCPFCGHAPFVGPENPEIEGNAFAYVECHNQQCPARPTVTDGALTCDDRGSAAYKRRAIARWNRRA